MYMDNSIIVAYWSRSEAVKDNWGDKLSPALIHGLTGLPVTHVNNIKGWQDRLVYRIIGSGLSNIKPNEAIWGMGFIDETSDVPDSPGPIYAVRGPKSRNRLIQAGIHCPEIYGDPAILYPLLYWPDITPTFDVGIIQHCREIDVISPPKVPAGISVKYIDVRGDINNFVDEILSCRMIISSSLHGIICAHSYGIPAYWLKASDLPIGDDFKFHDYFASIGVDNLQPLALDADGVCILPDTVDAGRLSRIAPDQLIDACPFIAQGRKEELKRKRRRMTRGGAKGTIFI